MLEVLAILNRLVSYPRLVTSLDDLNMRATSVWSSSCQPEQLVNK